MYLRVIVKEDGIINSTICEQVSLSKSLFLLFLLMFVMTSVVVVVVVVYHSFINYGFLFSYTHITLQEPFGPDTPL